MIPTAYMRWFKEWRYSTPVLQQLWAPHLGNETHLKSQSYIETCGGEWREIPLVTALAGEPVKEGE